MAWKPDYATTAEVKAYLRIADAVDDTQIGFAVAAASRAIDTHCHRQFGKVDTAAERVYTAVPRTDRGRWVVHIDDLMTITNLTVELDAGAVDLYTLEPRNAAADGEPWTRLVVDPDAANLPTGDEFEVAVTALWGWSSVPTTVKEATLLQTSRIVARRDSPFGVAGSPELGNELRLLAKVDPDVAVSLRPFVRPRWPR